MWPVVLLVLSVISIVVATAKLKLHPFLALLFAAFGYGILCGSMSLEEVVKSVNIGFGNTVGSIGIVILAGSIIGTFLEKSGGAIKVAESTIKLTGPKNVPMAMGLIGYIVSIPVFCDSGFVILSPLNKALSRKAGIPLAASAVALSLGLLATHSMVPPTPGPIAAAAALGADLGTVIFWGALVSIIALTGGWLFAVTFAARVHIEPEPTQDESQLEQLRAEAPSATKSLVPILFPLVLIVLRSFNELAHPFGDGNISTFIGFIGQPVVALLLGVFLAFQLPKKLSTEMLSPSGWVGGAVIAAATIIIITGAGGAFGQVLRNSGIGDVVVGQLAGTNIGIWLPFLIAAALKMAQGSGTVAIITTAGIMAPLLEVLGLDAPTARALVVVAIGAGAMIVSHANDSYFWVVTQLSNMTVKQGYQLQTLGTLVQGVVAALTVWVISLLLL